MKAHRNLTRQDVLRYGPAKLCLMIASEFHRAVSRCETTPNVISCYSRAKELMGILETQPLPLQVSHRLKPIYKRAIDIHLLAESELVPLRVSRVSAELASEFELASQKLQ